MYSLPDDAAASVGNKEFANKEFLRLYGTDYVAFYVGRKGLSLFGIGNV